MAFAAGNFCLVTTNRANRPALLQIVRKLLKIFKKSNLTKWRWWSFIYIIRNWNWIWKYFVIKLRFSDKAKNIFFWISHLILTLTQYEIYSVMSDQVWYFFSNFLAFSQYSAVRRWSLSKFKLKIDFMIFCLKVHIFWEGHKNMTKSPNFFWHY